MLFFICSDMAREFILEAFLLDHGNGQAMGFFHGALSETSVPLRRGGQVQGLGCGLQSATPVSHRAYVKVVPCSMLIRGLREGGNLFVGMKWCHSIVIGGPMNSVFEGSFDSVDSQAVCSIAFAPCRPCRVQNMQTISLNCTGGPSASRADANSLPV